MKWYHNMSKEVQSQFQKVIMVCSIGTIIILLIPIFFRILL